MKQRRLREDISPQGSITSSDRNGLGTSIKHQQASNEGPSHAATKSPTFLRRRKDPTTKNQQELQENFTLRQISEPKPSSSPLNASPRAAVQKPKRKSWIPALFDLFGTSSNANLLKRIEPDGAQKQGTRKPARSKNSPGDEDLPLIWVVVAVVCVATLVVIALSVLFYVLADHGYIAFQERQNTHGEFSTKRSSKQMHFPVIPSSKIYTIPNSMAHIGNKSDAYARLRMEWDEMHPPDTPNRSLAAMHRSRSPRYDSLKPRSRLPYNIYNCPDTPPLDYPNEFSTVQLLKHWPPSQSMPRDESTAHLSLCVFDFRRDYIKALKYRQNEVPFVVRNDPRVAETAERWNDEQYRSQLVGSDQVWHRAERSETLEFLYWRPDAHVKIDQDPTHPSFNATPKNWKEPTELVRMTYLEWYRAALTKKRQMDTYARGGVTHEFNSTTGPFYYFRLIGCGETGPMGDCDKIDTSEYLFDELPFFQPHPQQIYLTEPREQRGIHCRFGMPGLIAENHFDSSRNAIVVLGGQRRYILSHPRHCQNLALYPLGHPSARHSQVNWTHASYSDDWLKSYPQFQASMSNEVVLQSGDVLYLPTNWFHFIVSLSINFQCNARSGRTAQYDPFIRECGFGSPPIQNIS
jgi:Cupin-like domain